MFPETIETESLTLQPLSRDHVDVRRFYDRFGADAAHADAVFEHVALDPYATVKDARDQLVDAEDAFEDGESAEYAVYAGGDLAGFGGLQLEWERRTGRIGVMLDRPFWGNGYAAEFATALAELAFDDLDLELVAIGHEEGNERSKRFIESWVQRHGGQYDGVLRNWTPMDGGVADHHRYTVTREEYRAAIGE